MILSADSHARIAAAYEIGAADARLSPEDRAEFAWRAKRFRHLAEIAAKREASGVRPRADWRAPSPFGPQYR